MFKQLKKESFYYAAPVILMTTKDPITNIDNITAISSSWTLGKSVVLGIGLVNQGYINLSAGSDLTLNLADETSYESVLKISRATGNSEIADWKKALNYSYSTDKFSLGHFTKMDGQTVSSARIKECPIQLECKMIHMTERKEIAIVECDIKNILVDESILHDDRHIDVNKWQPLIYKFRAYTSTGKAFAKDSRFLEFSD